MIDRRGYGGPIEKAKKLLVRQFLRTVGRERRREAKKYLDDHFFDAAREEKIYPEIVKEKFLLDGWTLTEKVVYVLHKTKDITGLSREDIHKVLCGKLERIGNLKIQEISQRDPSHQTGSSKTNL